MIYNRAKEVSNVALFANQHDFSSIQIRFLEWLELYAVLEYDVAMDKPYITKDIFNDDIRIDAYLCLRERENLDKQEPKNKRVVDPLSPVPSVVFKRKK